MSNNFPAGFKRRAQSAESSKEKAVRLLSSKWMLNTSNMKFCKVDSCYLVIVSYTSLCNNNRICAVANNGIFIFHKNKEYRARFENAINEIVDRKLFCENKKLLVSCRTSKAYGNYAIIRNPVTMPKNAHELEIVE